MSRTATLYEIKDLISYLKYLANLNNYQGYDEVYKEINKFNIPIPTRSILPSRKLARCRRHEKHERYFEHFSDLSYIQNNLKIKGFGRANIPSQSIFYCSDSDFVAFAEISEITRKNIEKDYEIYTMGVWDVKSPITVINIISNPAFYGTNSSVDYFQREFDNYFEKLGSDKGWKYFLTFISEEFTSLPHHKSPYCITAAFTNYVYNNFPKVEGIMYPSVRYPFKGLNFAIFPLTVDKKIEFVTARINFQERIGYKEYQETDSADPAFIDYNRNLIIWPGV